MAVRRNSVPKWERTNRDEQALYITRYRKERDVLTRHLPAVIQSVDPSRLMCHLLNLGVIDKMVKGTITVSIRVYMSHQFEFY